MNWLDTLIGKARKSEALKATLTCLPVRRHREDSQQFKAARAKKLQWRLNIHWAGLAGGESFQDASLGGPSRGVQTMQAAGLSAATAGMDLPAEPEARERVELLGQTQGALQRLACIFAPFEFTKASHRLGVRVDEAAAAKQAFMRPYPRKAMSTKVIPDLSAALTLATCQVE